MKRIRPVLMVIVLACLCVLAWASVFVWHNNSIYSLHNYLAVDLKFGKQ